MAYLCLLFSATNTAAFFFFFFKFENTEVRLELADLLTTNKKLQV